MEYPQWQQPLLDAGSEPDLRKVEEKIRAAEEAIFQRTQELAQSSDGNRESLAISKGLNELLRIKIEILKWPPIELDDSGNSQNI